MLIENYIKTAWRNILRHKLFSFINILGLAIGLASVLLIMLFVRYELSFDNFWDDYENIYRIHVETTVPGKDPRPESYTPPPLAAAIKAQYPDLVNVTRVMKGQMIAMVDNTRMELRADLVDKEYLEVFDIKLIQGNIETALSDQSSLIINETQAIKFFGNDDPIGKVLTIDLNGDRSYDLRVTAVMENQPENTMFPIQGITPINESMFGRQDMLRAWYGNYFRTYIKVKPGTDIKTIEDRFPDFIARNFPRVPFAGPNTKPEDVIKITAMNIKDLHLNPQGDSYELGPIGNKNTVYIFSVIAFLILVIGSINFMNLSTARASQRAKEVAIRKVMGASRTRLITQFLGESVLYTLVSLLLALILVEGSLPFYNDVMSREMDINYMSIDIFYIFIFSVFVGLLGGIYPAFVLSKFHPANTLKANKSTETKASIAFRTTLVVIQFSISIALFVSTSVIFAQMEYAQNKDLGYDRDHMLTVYGNDFNGVRENIVLLQERFNQVDGVISTTYSDSGFPGSNFEYDDPIRTQRDANYDPIMIGFRQVGYDFLKTYDIPLLAGRAYDRNRPDERPTNEQLAAGEGFTAGLIINRSAARRLGFGEPEEAIGRLMYMNVGQIDNEGSQEILEAEFSVIGVIEDTHFNDLKNAVRPELYQLFKNRAYFIIMRFGGEDPMKILEGVQDVWKDILPTSSFEYHFSSDALAEQYAKERGEMTMYAAFSCLAIFIACLGLFGLASFTADRRTKEIGIRKVMGASIWQIVRLLVWQFSKPVFIANVIAWPIAFFGMSMWLDSFAYHINDMVIIALCLIAGLTALLIAWATVAGNSYVVARQNPIKALRYE